MFIKRVILGFTPHSESLGSPINKISLFHIRYLLEKQIKYYEVILCFKKKVKKKTIVTKH